MGIQKAEELYREKFGGSPERVFSAPGRVNLIGEHTDYNGGRVLPVAISQRTWVAVGKNSDHNVTVVSDFSPTSWSLPLDSSNPPADQDWALYPLGVAWLIHRRFGLSHGVNLAISSTVPVGAGLSSSAALEGATALSLASYLDTTPSLLDLAKIGQEAENTIVHAPTGLMDQVASLMSVADHATMIDFSDLTISHHRLDLAEHGLTLMVIDTRVKHSHSTGQYGQRRTECETARDILGVPALAQATIDHVEAAADLLGDVVYARAKHIVTENDRVKEAVRALESGILEDLGPLFLESHRSLRDDFEVSCDELDCAVEEAYEAGAVAARMTGGGFGGSAIALCPVDTAPRIRERIVAEFETRGFIPPAIFDTAIAEGGRQDR